MKREQRRLKTLERQRRIALTYRHEAISQLAGAMADEAQRAALAEKGRSLASGYAGSSDLAVASELRDRSRFASELSRIARDAEKSRDHAAAARDKASRELAKRETRLERLGDRIKHVRRESERKREQLEAERSSGLARKLLSKPQNSKD